MLFCCAVVQLFWLCWVCCVSCVVCCFVRSFHFPPDPPSAGPLRRTTLFVTAQNFALFFSLPATIFILSSLSWGVLSLNFGGVLKSRTLKLQTCTFQGPGASKTPPKFHERTPKREKKERKLWRGGKKSAKFWAPHPSGPPTLPGPIPEAGPHPSPTILGLGSCFFCPVCHFLFCPICRFFLSRLCFFLSRMQFFILSRQQVAHFVPFPFFLSRGVFFVPGRHPDAFWFSVIGPMCRLRVVNDHRQQGRFCGRTKWLANDRSKAELIKRVCIDNSDSCRRTRRSQQIKHVEDFAA